MNDASQTLKLLFHNRDFVLFLVTRSCNVIGVQILTVAVGWYVYQLTRDPLDLGYIGLAQFAPSLVLFLVAGFVSDKYDRRITLVLSNICHLSVIFLLLGVFWSGWGGVGTILLILVIHGIARTFFHTAAQAILPNIVTSEVFPNAVAYASSVNKAAQLIGPALGGVLLAWTENWTYYVAGLMFLVAVVCPAVMSRQLKRKSSDEMTLKQVLSGFLYVWQNKVVLGAVSIDLVAVLLGGIMGLLPIYASDILNAGPDGLGLMRAMPGIGALLMGLALAQVVNLRYVGATMFITLAVFGASIIVFSLSTIFWISLVALAIYGASDMVSVYIRLTLVQIATPDEMRGRVSAVNSISINASNELGDFRAGLMASGFGTVSAVLLGGVAALAVAGFWMKLFPDLCKINKFEDAGLRITQN
ncbi:MAG: MFS transporter [Pseudomonadota bacterium]|nr:MFS transporter [Pseudomonadota bacterium]